MRERKVKQVAVATANTRLHPVCGQQSLYKNALPEDNYFCIANVWKHSIFI